MRNRSCILCPYGKEMTVEIQFMKIEKNLFNYLCGNTTKIGPNYAKTCQPSK